MIVSDQQVDVDRFRREGYLTAPSVLSADDLEAARRESERILELCAAGPERYAARLEWEIDHLAGGERAGMEKVIRKIEPVSDLSPFFYQLAFHEPIASQV